MLMGFRDKWKLAYSKNVKMKMKALYLQQNAAGQREAAAGSALLSSCRGSVVGTPYTPPGQHNLKQICYCCLSELKLFKCHERRNQLFPPSPPHATPDGRLGVLQWTPRGLLHCMPTPSDPACLQGPGISQAKGSV